MSIEECQLHKEDSLIEKNKRLEDKCDRLCVLLGVATALIYAPKSCKVNEEWWTNAILEVVYKNKPVPPLPEEIK